MHYKRRTHKPVEYERDRNFPRDAPRFSCQCNGESFTPGLPTAKTRRREKEPHTFAKLDVENDASTARMRASKCTRRYVRRIRQESTVAQNTGERAMARVRGIVQQLACVGIFSETNIFLRAMRFLLFN